mmetsp:Transcript_11091/g.25879  ORF Transcript_11091/g.25879 Transcript_11091/m.25879 type:complete len:217 (-) Transcript_11091:59-709(-)
MCRLQCVRVCKALLSYVIGAGVQSIFALLRERMCSRTGVPTGWYCDASCGCIRGSRSGDHLREVRVAEVVLMLDVALGLENGRAVGARRGACQPLGEGARWRVRVVHEALESLLAVRVHVGDARERLVLGVRLRKFSQRLRALHHELPKRYPSSKVHHLGVHREGVPAKRSRCANVAGHGERAEELHQLVEPALGYVVQVSLVAARESTQHAQPGD